LRFGRLPLSRDSRPGAREQSGCEVAIPARGKLRAAHSAGVNEHARDVVIVTVICTFCILLAILSRNSCSFPDLNL
jgi:hypothetical protein